MSKTKDQSNPFTYPKVYNRFDRPEGPKLKCGPSLTQQQFKEECDINRIVDNFTRTGEWSKSGKPATQMPMFGDFTSAPDFQEAQNILIESNRLFDELPAGIRKRFNNNPADFLTFVGDPANTEEAITLGIATRRADKSSPPGGDKTGNPVSPQ